MKLDLTVYIVLVFFVPGSAVAGAVALSCPTVAKELTAQYLRPNALVAIGLLSLIFALGALADSARSLFVDKIFRPIKISQPKWWDDDDSKSYVRDLTSENLPVLSYLVEHSFEYYRFNANSALAFTILLFTYLITRGSDGMFGILLAVTAMLWFAARKTYNDNTWVISEFTKGAK